MWSFVHINRQQNCGSQYLYTNTHIEALQGLGLFFPALINSCHQKAMGIFDPTARKCFLPLTEPSTYTFGEKQVSLVTEPLIIFSTLLFIHETSAKTSSFMLNYHRRRWNYNNSCLLRSQLLSRCTTEQNESCLPLPPKMLLHFKGVIAKCIQMIRTNCSRNDSQQWLIFDNNSHEMKAALSFIKWFSTASTLKH